jgi:hypothetical protein
MRAGRAHSALCLERGALGELRPRLFVAALGQEPVAVGADAAFRLDGLPLGVALRAELLSSCPGVGAAPASAPFVSAPRTLGGAQGSSARADIRSDPAGLVFDVDLAGPDGRRKVTLAAVGLSAALAVTGLSASGEPYGGAAGALADPALVLTTSDARVAEVSAAGVVTARGAGLAFVRASGDGEFVEVLVEVDTRIDSDGDGMSDSFELAFGLDPRSDDAALDRDGDGLSNLEEFRRGTRPDRADTDGDGFSDGQEALVLGTDPLAADSDGDGSSDGAEVAARSDPLNPNEGPGSAFSAVHRSVANFNFWTGVQLAASPLDLAFATATDGSLLAYRVNPFNYFWSRTDDLPIGGDLRAPALGGSRVYLPAGNTGLRVVDALNPAALLLETTAGGLGEVRAAAVEGAMLHLATSTGLRILSQGAGGLTSLGALSLSGAERVAVNGGLAFLALPARGEVVAVDVLDPAQPRELGRTTFPAGSGVVTGLAAAQDAVYVAHRSAGVLAFSTARPEAMVQVDSSQADFAGTGAESLSLLGNRVAAFLPSMTDRAPIWRLLDAGGMELLGTAPLGPASPLGIALAQDFLFSVTAPRLSVTTVLPAGDRGSAAPTGSLATLAPAAVLPGGSVELRALARDDVYVAEVRFFAGGLLLSRDVVPPFRRTLRTDPSRPAPYTVEVTAVGVDLRGNEGLLGTALLAVDGDLDGDGTPDSLDPDRDGDGLSDVEERYSGADGWVSDPARSDTDGDGIADGEEALPGADGFVTDPGQADTDRDGLDDPFEVAATSTDPSRRDTDGDGIADGDEDGDADGLSNRGEAEAGTDPSRPDSDGDGLGDGIEVALGLDPTRRDSDGDGILDGDEDGDGDGLTNRNEVARGTDPGRADTDGDGFDDPTEIELGTDATAVTDFSGLDLVFRQRTVTLRGPQGAPLRVRSLTLESAVLTVPPAGGAEPQALDLEVEGLLRVDAASRIDADGRGWTGGRQPGNSSHLGLGPAGTEGAVELAGASHAGLGGAASGADPDAVPAAYGDLRRPELAGGGGSASVGGGAGGAGGGAVRITAGSVALDGRVTANGESVLGPGALGGGGAGGSVWIDCGRLSGLGSIDANGGDVAAAGSGGGGGGGRVAIRAQENAGFNLDRATARGGAPTPGPGEAVRAGGAGTVFAELGASGLARLIADNRGAAHAGGPRTFATALGDGTVLNFGDDFIVRAEGPFAHDVVGLEVDPDASDGDEETFLILEQDGARIRTEPGLLGRTQLGARFRGVLRLEVLAVRGEAALETGDELIVDAGAVTFSLRQGALHAPELTLERATGITLDRAELEAGALRGGPGDPGGLGAVTLTDSRLAVASSLAGTVVQVTRSSLSCAGTLSAVRLFLVGSVLTVPDPEPGAPRSLRVDVVDLFHVDATSAVDLTGKGYAGGYESGNPSPLGESGAARAPGGPSGGSHGGQGGEPGVGAAAAAYGDFALPGTPGGGGSANDSGGAAPTVHGGNGGGLVSIRAASLLLEGRIDVSGAPPRSDGPAGGRRAGAGAGGGASIEVGTLSGAGSVLARGGAVSVTDAAHGGAGGGGRIALVFSNRAAFTGTIAASGGEAAGAIASDPRHGAAGTVYLRRAASSVGELIADGEGRGPRRFRSWVNATEAGAARLERLSVRGGAHLTSERDLEVALLDESDPAKLTLRGGMRAPRLALPQVPMLEVISGEIDVTDIESAGSGVRMWTLRDSRLVLYEPLSAASMSVLSGSVLTVPDPTAQRSWALDLDLSGSLIVDPMSAVDLTGKGYVGGLRGGSSSSIGQTADHALLPVGGRTGGSHGGLGGVQGPGPDLGEVVAGVFDDFSDPRRPGGGGSGRLGAGEPGYNGGGLVRVRAASIVVSGRLSVDGDGRQRPGNSTPSGAGAGGGVRLEADLLLGSGTVSADGGAGDGVAGSGCGGGGRIAVIVDDVGSFTGSIHALGGALVPAANRPQSVGGAGTVLFRRRAQTFGDLVVDNGGRASSPWTTPLRPVGSGAIVTLGPQTLRAAGPFPTSDTGLQGQWVVLNGQVMRTFRITANSAVELQTDPADGDMTQVGAPGGDWRGALVVNTLAVRGAAGFDTRGDVIITMPGGVTVAPGAGLLAPPVVER